MIPVGTTVEVVAGQRSSPASLETSEAFGLAQVEA